MNNIFKVIWNHATQTWTAVGELASAKGKSKSVKLAAVSTALLVAAGGVLAAEGAQTPSNELANLLSGNANSPASTLSILNSPEVSEAMFWMRETGITNATNISTFNPFDSLTREQAAKMVVQYAKSQNIPALSGSDFCSFSLISP